MGQWVILGGILLLGAACRDRGAPTADQNRDLDDISQMLEDAPNSLNAVDDAQLLEGNASNDLNQQQGR